MRSSLLLPLALGYGWLFSPESLVIIGNSAGNLGWLSIPLFALVALIFSICNRTIIRSKKAFTKSCELNILKQSIGNIPAASLTLSSSFPLLVLAGSALLVTSGYTFNEVFLYWFPNFGFAFLLLGLLTLVQFLPIKYLQRLQLCFVSLAALGILSLGIYGSFTPAKPLVEILQQPGQISAATLSSALLLLLFAGSNLFQEKEGSFFPVPLIAVLVFMFWIFASLAHVDTERLASSTIPYMTASRKILGDTGRQIMGLVVISGSCAAVTGLMLLCRQQITDLAREHLVPQFMAKGGQRWLLPPLMAIASGICMATGLAGDELLEVLLKSALLLWLLHYCCVSLSAALLLKNESQTLPLPALLAPTLLLVGWFAIIFSSPYKTETLIFIISSLVASACLAAVWFFSNPRKKDTP